MIDKTAKYSFGAVLTLLIALCPGILQAQNSVASKRAESKPRLHRIEVTGCLQKSNEPGEFSITGEGGKAWDLRSSKVKLSKHVGHNVTVTGVPYHETKKEEAKEEKAETGERAEGGVKEAKESEEGHLRVTGLKMISKSCSK
jgi:hypothetical protein